jgi:LysM repeat protein
MPRAMHPPLPRATPTLRRHAIRAGLLGGALLTLAGCAGQPLDFDLRSLVGGFSTSDAARGATAARPRADNRGVISYPNYQVAIARKGDRIGDVAARIGIPPQELARYNGIALDTVLNANEVIALPKRVAEPSPATGAASTGPIRPTGGIDITTLAENAIDRAGGSDSVAPATGAAPSGKEPIRHKVERGETAYSIARLYNVSVRALSEWNGLGPDLSVRAGQFLLIPVVVQVSPAKSDPTAPGQGSATPTPPSAATPLPGDEVSAAAPAPASPNLGDARTSASDTARFAMPVVGKIIRTYVKKKNDGIDIAADAGTPVVAAADGVVAAITRDTDQVPIVVLKHADNMLTVYAGVDNLKIKKGDRVKRGQKIATVRAGDPSFLHFEIRKGLDSVDPMPFLN